MSLHAVYFSPLDCALRFWDGYELKQEGLKKNEAMEFSAEKYCFGYNDGEKMRPCPMRAGGAKQCPVCAARDIARMYTRLDYSGFESQYEKFRQQAFSVYLASFGHLVKCGVTRSARLMDRVREQGADYFVEIGKAADAETAYAIETLLQQNFALRNGLTSAQKMKLMNADSPARITECVSKVKESALIEDYEGEMQVKKLDYPVPQKFSEAIQLDGEILGCKGQILFFSKSGSDFGVNMSKKAGAFFTRAE